MKKLLTELTKFWNFIKLEFKEPLFYFIIFIIIIGAFKSSLTFFEIIFKTFLFIFYILVILYIYIRLRSKYEEKNND